MEILYINMSQPRFGKTSKEFCTHLCSSTTSSLSPSRSFSSLKACRDENLPEKITNIAFRTFLQESPLNSNSRLVDSYTARYQKSTIFDPPEPPRMRRNILKPADTLNSLGNDNREFYRKNGNVL